MCFGTVYTRECCSKRHVNYKTDGKCADKDLYPKRHRIIGARRIVTKPCARCRDQQILRDQSRTRNEVQLQGIAKRVLEYQRGERSTPLADTEYQNLFLAPRSNVWSDLFGTNAPDIHDIDPTLLAPVGRLRRQPRVENFLAFFYAGREADGLGSNDEENLPRGSHDQDIWDDYPELGEDLINDEPDRILSFLDWSAWQTERQGDVTSNLTAAAALERDIEGYEHSYLGWVAPAQALLQFRDTVRRIRNVEITTYDFNPAQVSVGSLQPLSFGDWLSTQLPHEGNIQDWGVWQGTIASYVIYLETSGHADLIASFEADREIVANANRREFNGQPRTDS